VLKRAGMTDLGRDEIMGAVGFLAARSLCWPRVTLCWLGGTL
jgi:hypothetical protein